MEQERTGTMSLSSASAAALWRCEVLGQLSDGAWENALPDGHWRFWAGLDLVVGDSDVVVPAPGSLCSKNRYGIVGLASMKDDSGFILRGRMLAYGRLARAGADPGDEGLCALAEHMPPTLIHFYVKTDPNTARMDPALVQAYYATTYGIRDLSADLRRISAAMRTVTVGRHGGAHPSALQ